MGLPTCSLLSHLVPEGAPRKSCGRGELLPDKLKLDWWRFLMGGGWCLEGEDLAEGAGVAYFGVAGTSYTGPSYMPLGTPCNPETYTEGGEGTGGRDALAPAHSGRREPCGWTVS